MEKSKKPVEYENKVFTMENPTTTESINLKQIDLNDAPKQADAIEPDGCKCIADKLGMDADRLSKFYSLALALLATLAITCSIFLVKLSIALSASDMAVVKFSVQILFCLPFAYFYRQDLFGPKGSRILLLFRGLLGALSILSAYFSIKMIHFADSMVIRYSSPLVTALFARIILKEKLSLIHIISFGLSIIGVLCVVRPSFLFRQFGQQGQVETSLEFILGIILALFSAISAGSTFVFIKKLTNKKIHFTIIIFYFSFLGFLISSGTSLVLYLTNLTHQNLILTKQYVLKDISIGLLAGLISFFGHVCFTLAIARNNANKIAVLRTIDILIAFVLEYLILDVAPHWVTLLGAFLILLSVLVIYVYKFLLNKRKRDTYTSNNESNVFRI